MFTLELVQLWHQAPRRPSSVRAAQARRRHSRRAWGRPERRRG